MSRAKWFILGIVAAIGLYMLLNITLELGAL